MLFRSQNAVRSPILQCEIDKRCFACRYHGLMHRRTQIVEDMLRVDATLLPVETEPTVKSATSKMIDEYISSLTKEGKGVRAECNIEKWPLPPEPAILKFTCQVIEARWRNW